MKNRAMARLGDRPVDQRTPASPCAPACPLQPSAAPAQAHAAVGRPLRGHAAILAALLAKTPMAALALPWDVALVRALGGVEAGEAPSTRARWKRRCGGMWWRVFIGRQADPNPRIPGSFPYRP